MELDDPDVKEEEEYEDEDEEFEKDLESSLQVCVAEIWNTLRRVIDGEIRVDKKQTFDEKVAAVNAILASEEGRNYIDK
ncbi:MAG: hypothetical protein L6R39_004059 [Caloplaca ligustica]|nr:MAG: hypothetical protein L6R39_004059 [Caloplaca ligustica]